MLRRLRFAAGAGLGRSNNEPFAALSRPCLRVRGEIRDALALSSSLGSALGDDVARSDRGPKNQFEFDGDDCAPF